MGSKRIREMEENLEYKRIYCKYKLLALNMFKYKNLPEGVEERFIEKALYEKGECIFYNDSNLGFITLPSGGSFGQNYQGEPIGTTITGVGYTKSLMNEDDFIRILNNDLRIPTNVYVEDYAYKMLKVNQAISANINQQKFPYLFVCDSKSKTAMKSVYEQIENGEPAIYGGKEIDLQNNVLVMNTNAPYVVDKLQEYKYELEREILTFFGLNNNFEKKERMLTDEINSNNDYINSIIDLMYKSRKEGIEKINKKYGLNIIVEKVNGIEENVSRETLEGSEE